MSLKSMTAFGSGELSTANTQYRCEIRTLNSRFCDISIKLPRSLLALEPQLLALVKAHVQRGKIDVFFDLSQTDKASHLPKLNEAAVHHYLGLAAELSRLSPELTPLSQFEVLRLEGTLETGPSIPGDTYVTNHEENLRAVIEIALDRVSKQRAGEGAVLKTALIKLVDAMRFDREAILAKREIIQSALFDSYKKRLDRLLGLLDESVPDISTLIPDERLLTELAILTDRADIEEELTRLKAHEDEFLRILNSEDEAGRKLDFLCQEMHREVNTISNKLTQLDVATHSLTLKQTIERLKQQVQNIE
ncbi:MAG: YicC family protein [Chitinophagaceae bacterium]|nr:YicC family protein [Oligoflexus sp.]